MILLAISLDSTLITAIVTAIVTVGLFIVKETIENIRNRKKEDQQKVDTFRAYTDPLMDAGFLLYERLMEIFQKNAKFLYEKAPKNHFNQYRYISTLHRLCVVLGWVRAVKRELAGMDLHDKEQYNEMNKSIDAFQRSLYDNKYMEGARMDFLTRKWGFDMSEMESEDVLRMEEEIAQKIWDVLAEEDKIYARNLSHEKQDELILHIANIMAEHCGEELADENEIHSTRPTVIRAISRTEAWIYLDWQLAIGGIMLEPSSGINPLRKFNVKGFEKFEDMYLDYLDASKTDESIRNRWIGRIDKLFYNLNIDGEKKYDARIQQLRNVGSALLHMIQNLEELSSEGTYKPSHKLQEYLDFDAAESNPEYYQDEEVEVGHLEKVE